MWHHTFHNQLNLLEETPKSGKHGVFLTEYVDNPMVNKQKTTEIRFKAFNVRLPWIYGVFNQLYPCVVFVLCAVKTSNDAVAA